MTTHPDLARITDPDEEYQRNLLDQFVTLYSTEFTDPAETEDPGKWVDELRAGDSARLGFFVVVVESAGTVQGGVVFEYYRDSQVALMTYLVVAKEYRGKGLSRMLLTKAAEVLAEHARSRDREVRAVLAEVHRLRAGLDAEEVEVRAKRLVITASLGGKLVDLRYVQPRLDEGQARSYELLLVAFPGLAGPAPTGQAVGEFLREFYAVLKDGGPDDKDVSLMLRRLRTLCGGDEKRRIGLRELPGAERPWLRLRKVGLTLHFMTSDRPGPPSFCRRFSSFEADLLVEHLQRNKALSSKVHLDEPVDVEIYFPEFVDYLAEGRRERVFCPDAKRRCQARVQLNYTRFRDVDLRIWHLVLHPVDDGWFDEYDLIKLLKLTGDPIERTNLRSSVRFALPARRNLSLSQLLTELSGQASFPAPSASIVEIDAEDLVTGSEHAAEWTELLADIKSEFRLRPDRLPELYAEDGLLTRLYNALCGIVVKILDFDEMSYSEMTDTLGPSLAAEGEAVVLHRANLVTLVSDANFLVRAWESVGADPYWTIAHAVLLCNEKIIDRAEETIDGVRDERRLPPLVAAEAEADRLLTHRLIGTVFHYDRERDFVRFGLERKGIRDRHEHVARKLAALQTRITTVSQWRNELGSYMITAVLGLISLSSVVQALSALLTKDALDKTRILSWAGAIVILGVVTVAFVIAAALMFPRRRDR